MPCFWSVENDTTNGKGQRRYGTSTGRNFQSYFQNELVRCSGKLNGKVASEEVTDFSRVSLVCYEDVTRICYEETAPWNSAHRRRLLEEIGWPLSMLSVASALLASNSHGASFHSFPRRRRTTADRP